jgi:hypothetical protein
MRQPAFQAPARITEPERSVGVHHPAKGRSRHDHPAARAATRALSSVVPGRELPGRSPSGLPWEIHGKWFPTQSRMESGIRIDPEPVILLRKISFYRHDDSISDRRGPITRRPARRLGLTCGSGGSDRQAAGAA